jgi:hypothetical protein
LQKVSFQDHKEEILCKVLRVRRGVAAAINESEDRPPVNLAELREAGIDLASWAGNIALANQTPTGCDEVCQSPARALDNAISSHVFNVIGLDFPLKHKMGKTAQTESRTPRRQLQ